MVDAIVSKTFADFQLINISIELINKLYGLIHENPSLLSNPHVKKMTELAQKWNSNFNYHYDTSREGGCHE